MVCLLQNSFYVFLCCQRSTFTCNYSGLGVQNHYRGLLLLLLYTLCFLYHDDPHSPVIEIQITFQSWELFPAIIWYRLASMLLLVFQNGHI